MNETSFAKRAFIALAAIVLMATASRFVYYYIVAGDNIANARTCRVWCEP